MTDRQATPAQGGSNPPAFLQQQTRRAPRGSGRPSQRKGSALKASGLAAQAGMGAGPSGTQRHGSRNRKRDEVPAYVWEVGLAEYKQAELTRQQAESARAGGGSGTPAGGPVTQTPSGDAPGPAPRAAAANSTHAAGSAGMLGRTAAAAAAATATATRAAHMPPLGASAGEATESGTALRRAAAAAEEAATAGATGTRPGAASIGGSEVTGIGATLRPAETGPTLRREPSAAEEAGTARAEGMRAAAASFDCFKAAKTGDMLHQAPAGATAAGTRVADGAGGTAAVGTGIFLHLAPTPALAAPTEAAEADPPVGDVNASGSQMPKVRKCQIHVHDTIHAWQGGRNKIKQEHARQVIEAIVTTIDKTHIGTLTLEKVVSLPSSTGRDNYQHGCTHIVFVLTRRHQQHRRHSHWPCLAEPHAFFRVW